MIDAECVELQAQLQAADRMKLLRVQFDSQPMLKSAGQH